MIADAVEMGVDLTFIVSSIENRYRLPSDMVRLEWLRRMEHQDLLSGLIRLHVLHHAVKGEVYGQWMIEELARHGYKLSAGTLYPMLRSMEKRGYLTSEKQRAGRSIRQIYHATPLGRDALEMARGKVYELIGELIEHRGG